MPDFTSVINLIYKYEGFNESAYPDVNTGAEPYTIGYGTQFYPDGSPVKNGQYCTKQKAWEYLFHELQVINEELRALNLGLTDSMRQALISFIHSIGWDSFLYSDIVDHMDTENWEQVTKGIAHWVFDQDGQVVGTLLDRRREEISLFISDINEELIPTSGILLSAFRNYFGSPPQQKAIETLEKSINPYELSKFINCFKGVYPSHKELFELSSDKDSVYGLDCFDAVCDI